MLFHYYYIIILLFSGETDMIIFTCKDNFESMMTCIYDAWDSGAGHQNIRLLTEPFGNMELFCEYRHINADPEKSRKVMRAIRQKISSHACQTVFQCAASDHRLKLDMIYRFLLLGFHYGTRVMDMLQNPAVTAVMEQERRVQNETHLFREFIRFQSLPGGVLSALIEPRCNVVPLIYPYFEDRLPSENWMITDPLRKICAVHPADSRTFLTSLNESELSQITDISQTEDRFTALWRSFFQSTTVKERINPSCQQTHLPQWYRKYMPEF